MQNTNEISTLEVNARERLLETATELFAEKGYAGASVREIVEKAGVSKPVLYYYFKSKEGLFYAILEWAAAVQQNILNEIFEARGTVLERFVFLYRRVYEGIYQFNSIIRKCPGYMSSVRRKSIRLIRWMPSKSVPNILSILITYLG